MWSLFLKVLMSVTHFPPNVNKTVRMLFISHCCYLLLVFVFLAVGCFRFFCTIIFITMRFSSNDRNTRMKMGCGAAHAGSKQGPWKWSELTLHHRGPLGVIQAPSWVTASHHSPGQQLIRDVNICICAWPHLLACVYVCVKVSHSFTITKVKHKISTCGWSSCYAKEA